MESGDKQKFLNFPKSLFAEIQRLKFENLNDKLEAKQEKIITLEEQIKFLKEQISFFKEQNNSLIEKLSQDKKLLALLTYFMNESTDKSQKINVGGNFNINATQSVVNLRDIIGDVNHTINQIPADTSPQNQELKTLLQELTEAIQTEATLDDEEKAEAANQVKKIAQASQSPDDSALQTKAKKAVNLLETISKGLEPASKLFKACQKILPLIMGFLGL
jgi:predicted  nucleic acid-binding Zn-ribbon protein